MKDNDAVVKRKSAITAGGLSAILVDGKDILTPAERDKLIAARKTLLEVVRRL